MSQYTKSTNFATKDNLSPGDPLKIVRGTEIDTEFNNIATAISTKTDNSAAAITGGSISGITDLAIADGGTGASTATAALNNLLPSQTGNSSKYLQTDGTNATWDAISINTGDITGTLPVANGGTGVTSSTGTGSVVLSNSPTLVTPALGTPASGVATNLTGLPISTGVSGLGTGVATFLGTPSSANLASAVSDETGSGALVFANSPTLVTPALGTPSALVGTNITGTASGLTAGNVTTNANLTGAVTSVGNATSLGSFSSANLLGALTDETGTGSAVFATSPTLVTPILGTPTSATLTNATGLPIATGVSGLGTGVATALVVNVGSAGAPLVNGGVLGTPSSGTVTNLTGTASININGTVGATTATTGAFTTVDNSNGVRFNTSGSEYARMQLNSTNLELMAGSTTTAGITLNSSNVATLTNNPVLTAGSANGVTYLNGSKVLTSGSALTFDGTNLNLGVTPSAWGSGLKAIQIGPQSSLNSGDTAFTAATRLSTNTYSEASYVFKRIDSGFASSYYQQAGAHYWETAGSSTAGSTISFTQAMTLDASGNLLVGTTSTTPANVNGTIAFGGADAGIIYLERQTGTDQLRFYVGGNRLGYLNTASSAVTLGTANYPLVFATNDTERARISSGGQFTVGTGGTTYLPEVGVVSLNASNSTGLGPVTIGQRNGTNDWIVGSYSYIVGGTSGSYTVQTGGSGGVYVASGGTSWTAVSDERKKDIIEPITNATSKVNQLRAVIGKYKTDAEGIRRSFLIAQDVQAVLPEAVDATNSEQLGLSYSDIIPLLVASIKEQNTIIESLRQRLSAANL